MKEQIVVFGIGYIGKWFINEIGFENVKSIIDNNQKLWGKQWENIEIISLQEYIDRKYENSIAITSATYYKEIAMQLERNNIFDYEIYAQKWIEMLLVDKINKLDTNQAKMFLMNTHCFRNIGDYAITYAEKLMLEKWKYEVIFVPACICKDGMKYLKKIINTSDTIIISGGGYLGNLWMNCGEETARSIVSNFGENKVVIFPQSIYFTNDIDGRREKKKSAQIYNRASKLVLFSREQRSYRLGREIIKKGIFICPDIVLSLCDTYNDEAKEYKRESISICFRNDKEMIISDLKRKSIIEKVRDKYKKIDFISMEIPENKVVNESEADAEVIKLMTELKRCRLVITDRLHCLLLCVVTKTPCLFLDNISKKLSETYVKWLAEIAYVKEFDYENFEVQINEFMSMSNMAVDSPSFIDNFSQLHKEIEG